MGFVQHTGVSPLVNTIVFVASCADFILGLKHFLIESARLACYLIQMYGIE